MAFHMDVKNCQQIDKSASGYSERSWRHHAGGSLKVFEMRENAERIYHAFPAPPVLDKVVRVVTAGYIFARYRVACHAINDAGRKAGAVTVACNHLNTRRNTLSEVPTVMNLRGKPHPDKFLR
jgi:hypothetical protein